MKVEIGFCPTCSEFVFLVDMNETSKELLNKFAKWFWNGVKEDGLAYNVEDSYGEYIGDSYENDSNDGVMKIRGLKLARFDGDATDQGTKIASKLHELGIKWEGRCSEQDIEYGLHTPKEVDEK